MELKRYLIDLFKRTIISLLLFFLLSLFLKQDKYYYKLHNIMFISNIDFSYIKSKTNYLLGKYIYDEEKYVSSEKLIYKNIEKIDNSYLLKVDDHLIINNLCNGVVVSKDENKIIVDCDSNISITYENLENININLYDYISKGIILGNVKNDELVLTFKNGEEYISYENFI